jgi:nicotinamide-nucleotide amidase
MADEESIATLAEALVTELIAAQKTVATAESCTGGWIAKSLTDVSGSSGAFGYGVVSYSNGAKESILGVAARTLEQYGAVSEATVREMVDGVLRLSGADLAVAVSGVAGPDGGSEEKPVGTVWIAFAERGQGKPRIDAAKHVLGGDRATIRARTVILALQGLRERLRIRG